MRPDDTREWYYELDGARKGPISERRLRADFELDGVTTETLVWTSGMEDWEPFGSIEFDEGQKAGATEPAAPGDTPPDEDPLVPCAFSGEQHRRSRMLPFGDLWVSPEHREAFVQHLAESGESPDVPLDGFPFPATFTLETVLGQCFRIFGAQWKAIALFCISLYGPFYLVAEYISLELLAPAIEEPGAPFGKTSFLGAIWGPVFLGIGIELFLGSFVTAGLFGLAKDRWQGRSERDLGEVVRGAAHQFLPVLMTRLILFLIYLVIGAAIGVLVFSGGGLSLLFPLAAVTLVLFAFLGTRLTSAEALAVLDGRGGSPALQTSWTLTRGNFWKVLGFRLLVMIPLGLIGGLAGLLVEIPFPLFQNFVTSALITTLIAIPTAFSAIFEMVLAIHLKAIAGARPENADR